jgi:S-adenosylmethionine hydrolase
MSIITLLTDFGNQDSYVGVMKGVIAQIAPTAILIDLTHAIPPQDILAARFNLLNSYRYFPDGTVHLVVVDPGVGTERRAIAIQLDQGYLVAPDNGVLSGVLEDLGNFKAVTLENRQYWRTPQASHTFHGRDIFAPVAAHLANGVALEQLGPPLPPDDLTPLPLPPWRRSQTGITGTLQYIDHFGNLVTNIPGHQHPPAPWAVILNQHSIPGKLTYGEVEPGTLLSLVGSHGWVEIAVNGGSAAQQLQAQVGDEVRLVVSSE